jgi:SAM-dependent methyltransferase
MPADADASPPVSALFPDALARYEWAAAQANGRVLDVGAGAGAGAVMLHEAGARRVVAVDFDEEAVDAARARHAVRGLEFRVADAEALDGVRGPFEVVCAFGVLEQLEDPARAIGAIAGRLAPAGALLLSVPDEASPVERAIRAQAEEGEALPSWSSASLAALLAPHFAQVEILHQVMGHAAVARRQAAEALRAPRGAGAGGQAAIARLAAPGPADFPIVRPRLAPIYGVPHALLAVCQGAKRRR